MPDMPTAESTLEALHALKDSLALIPEERLKPIRVKPSAAWESAGALYAQFQTILPLLDKEYAPERANALRQMHSELMRYAAAFYAADAQLDAFARQSRTLKPPEIKDLEKKLREDDKLLMTWARQLFSGHPAEEAKLKHVRARRGLHDTASDVTAMVAIFQRQWPWVLEGGWDIPLAKQGISLETLKDMEQRVTEWLAFVAKPQEMHESHLLRLQAYTAFYERYDALLKAGRHLMPTLTWKGLGRNKGRLKS